MRRTRIKFDGTIYARSSAGAGGPPGETEIMALNPERAERIKAVTGWSDVAPGTLNLCVDDRWVQALATVKPTLAEPPVTYPEQYAGIPAKRGGYWYYRGRVKTDAGQRQDVLVRRAVNPCKGVVEVLAPVRLRDTLGLTDGTRLNVRVVAEPAQAEPAAAAAAEKASFSCDAPVTWGTPTTEKASFFFDARHRPVRLDGLYSGGHAFLIAGGPSFAAVDKTALRFCFTMCLNNGVKACMPDFRPSAWTMVDGADKFLYTAWQDPKILKLVPDYMRKKWLWNSDLAKPCDVAVKQCPGVVYFKRTSGFSADTFLTEPGACWGNSKDQRDANGVPGRRSVLLVALKALYMLGFRHVYLLGVDFNMQPDRPYSFAEQKTKGACKGNNSTYAQLQWRFEQLQPRFEKAGFRVYNCNPASKLTAFETLDYAEAVRRALGFVHDPDAYRRGELENVTGLYQSKWYVCPACGASSRWEKEQCRDGKAVCACGRAVTEEDRKKFAKDPDQRKIESGAA